MCHTSNDPPCSHKKKVKRKFKGGDTQTKEHFGRD